MTKYRSLESRVQITREADEEPELLRLAQGRVQKKINHPGYIKKHTQRYSEISENFWSLSLRHKWLLEKYETPTPTHHPPKSKHVQY